MGEVLVEFPELIRDDNGRLYRARACGGEMDGHLWHGWIEFEPVEGGTPLRSGRETTQPNEVDTRYWATGLTPVYLEGALRRAQHPPSPRGAPPAATPAFEGPAPDREVTPPARDAVLNPFSAIQKGETLLRRQLLALSPWHLVNIVHAYQIPTGGEDPEAMTSPMLVSLIVDAARGGRETSSP